MSYSSHPSFISTPIFNTIAIFSGLKNTILEWESRELSNGKSTCFYVATVSFCLKLILMNNTRIRLKCKGTCLKQENKERFSPKNVVNLFFVFVLGTWSRGFKH